MTRSFGASTRGASPVIGALVLVSVVVVIGATTTLYLFDTKRSIQPDAPQVQLSHSLVEDDGEQTVAVTLEAGDPVPTDQLYVSGSKHLDVGGPPGSSTPADEAHASRREKFTESSGDNPPQVGIGETWDAGETVYIDPAGSANGVTIEFFWSAQPVPGVNPGNVADTDAYKIQEITV